MRRLRPELERAEEGTRLGPLAKPDLEERHDRRRGFRGDAHSEQRVRHPRPMGGVEDGGAGQPREVAGLREVVHHLAGCGRPERAHREDDLALQLDRCRKGSHQVGQERCRLERTGFVRDQAAEQLAHGEPSRDESYAARDRWRQGSNPARERRAEVLPRRGHEQLEDRPLGFDLRGRRRRPTARHRRLASEARICVTGPGKREARQRAGIGPAARGEPRPDCREERPRRGRGLGAERSPPPFGVLETTGASRAPEKGPADLVRLARRAPLAHEPRLDRGVRRPAGELRPAVRAAEPLHLAPEEGSGSGEPGRARGRVEAEDALDRARDVPAAEPLLERMAREPVGVPVPRHLRRPSPRAR
ncbi:MAG: hypothetical protein E6J75_15370 [Deltaproteobacteria bacterium]|nr:MAG: hypothetical protein E6J75_15370 [Deltaproteobacteria bacterium]